VEADRERRRLPAHRGPIRRRHRLADPVQRAARYAAEKRVVAVDDLPVEVGEGDRRGRHADLGGAGVDLDLGAHQVDLVGEQLEVGWRSDLEYEIVAGGEGDRVRGVEAAVGQLVPRGDLRPRAEAPPHHGHQFVLGDPALGQALHV
jgi:hypothetical protein